MKFNTDIKNKFYFFSFTRADAHLYGHLYPIIHTDVVEYENLRHILLKLEPLVDYISNLEKDVDGATFLAS